MNYEYHLVRNFHEAFGHPISDIPQELPQDVKEFRAKLMREEIEEFIEADNKVDSYDALLDLAYFLLGTLVEMGIPPDLGFYAVHGSNMNKLFPDGKPRYRKDGKIIKPDDWQGPESRLELIIKLLGG